VVAVDVRCVVRGDFRIGSCCKLCLERGRYRNDVAEIALRSMFKAGVGFESTL